MSREEPNVKEKEAVVEEPRFEYQEENLDVGGEDVEEVNLEGTEAIEQEDFAQNGLTHGFDNSFDLRLLDEWDVFEEAIPPELEEEDN